MTISSVNNEKVKYWASLKLKKNRDKDKCFLVEGNHLIKEAKEKGLVISTISISDNNADFLVTKEIMKKISDQKSISDNAAIVRYIPEQEIKGNVLILDDIQDPGNLGTLIRSSIAFGFSNIIMSEGSVDLYNSKVIRATEGMIFNINTIRTNIIEYIPKLKDAGYKILVSDVVSGKDIKNENGNNIALVLGNEGKGVHENIKELCDEVINIKMDKACESLNVGVAGSILMYEVYNGRINNSR